MRITDLVPDSKNANKGTLRGLKELDKSLRQNGAGRSILIDVHNRIIAGNKTAERAADIGLDDVIVVETDGTKLVAVKRTDLDLEQGGAARELAYADNWVGQIDLDWNADQVLADLEAGDEALREMLKDLAEHAGIDIVGGPTEDPGAQIDRAEELREKWGTETGQLWRVGEHRVICGDCTDAAVVAKVMGGEKAAMAVTSPPYGVGKSYETKGIAPWFETVRPAIKNLCQYTNVVVWQIIDWYCTGSQHIEPTLAYSINMFGENGYRPIWIRIWEKQGQNHGVAPYHLVSNKPVQQYEYVSAFTEDGIDVTDYEWVAAFADSKYRFTRRLSKAERSNWGHAGVWKINTVKANDDHPAMFPLELPERCIKMHSGEKEQVLDPFLGSGTTLVACERLGRKGRGIEISPAYVAVTLQRLAGMGLMPELCE